MKSNLAESAPLAGTMGPLLPSDRNPKASFSHAIGVFRIHMEPSTLCTTQRGRLFGGHWLRIYVLLPRSFIKNGIGRLPLATSEYPRFPGATGKNTPAHAHQSKVQVFL